MGVTKEPLDGKFVKEEFMRVNGHTQQHLLIGPLANSPHTRTHWHRLHSTNAWAESARAYGVSHKSPLTQRFADAGRMSASIPTVVAATKLQSQLFEQIAREEGTFQYDPPEQEDE